MLLCKGQSATEQEWTIYKEIVEWMRDVEKPDNTHYVYLKFVMAILSESMHELIRVENSWITANS